ncbi:MAG: DUF3999 domain-containing protein [Proteobacteria bacterium]|nr:DUF3999 domain-containing protein [Pseudomonadota bacterium]
MIRSTWGGRSAWALVLVPCLALASMADDYAWQWPLATPEADAGAYRVELDAAVYGAARSPGLHDVDVLNAEGIAVPAQLFAPDAAPDAGTRRLPLRWFALPQPLAERTGDIAMSVERDADGSVRRVETRLSGATTADAGDGGSWLVDASALREPVAALWLEWAPEAGSIDRRYRIEGSDDLRDWRLLQSQAPLLDLARDGERLQQRRLPVDAQAKYLRLTPAGGTGALRLTGVEAELRRAATAPDPLWQSLAGRAVEERGVVHYEFDLDGRFPVESADVQLAGNSTGEWTLYSRDDAEAPWQRRAGPWISYRIGADERSAPQALDRRVRDRHWKLVGRVPSPQAPALRLGWRPEALVFVAQGTPPYRLVAGSARAARGDAPVARSLDAIRGARGASWQPAVATLGAAQPLAGDRALQPAPEPRDWRSWILWGLLVAGAALVAGFAFSLLRQPRASS